jgi:hypothetical protein
MVPLERNQSFQLMQLGIITRIVKFAYIRASRSRNYLQLIIQLERAGRVRFGSTRTGSLWRKRQYEISEAGQATGVHMKLSVQRKERVSRRWSTQVRCNAIVGGGDRGEMNKHSIRTYFVSRYTYLIPKYPVFSLS